MMTTILIYVPSAQEAQVLGHGFYTLTVGQKPGDPVSREQVGTSSPGKPSSWGRAIESALVSQFG